MAAQARVSAAASAVTRNKFAFMALTLQVVFIILFSLFATYEDDPMLKKSGEFSHLKFSAYSDISLFLVLGFGLFCGLLRRYQYSSIAYNVLIVALVLQWGVLCCQFMSHGRSPGQAFTVGYESFLRADFAVVAVLVSFGAVFGKVSPVQLLFMAVVETVVYAINCYIGCQLFQAVDGGQAIFVHLFGCYFGLAVSRALHQQHFVDHPQEKRTYFSDITGFIGALVLFAFFKQFNAVHVPESLWERVAVNTDFAIVAAIFGAFFCSAVIGDGRFNIRHIQNAIVAGGVSVATVCHWMIRPYTALWVGLVAGVLSVVGFVKIGPCLMHRCSVHDTRGVHSSHGIPAILSVVISLIYAAFVNVETYGSDMYLIFPAMVPTNETTDVAVQQMIRDDSIEYGSARTAAGQVLYQFLAAIVSLALALVAGFVTGFIMRFELFEPVNADSAFDDRDYWAISEELLPVYNSYVPPQVEEDEPVKEANEETVQLTTTKVVEEQETQD